MRTKYYYFTLHVGDLKPGAKTRVYTLTGTATCKFLTLGIIHWCGAWRKMVFVPHPGRFTAAMLKEIAEVVERVEAHRQDVYFERAKP